MRTKGLIALSFTLLILGALVLAGKPTKGQLTPMNEAIGTGQCALQVTPDNHLKVTVTLRGAEANAEYHVRLYSQINPDSAVLDEEQGVLATNSEGSGRLSVVTTGDFTPGDWHFDVRVLLGTVYRFHNDYDVITFY